MPSAAGLQPFAQLLRGHTGLAEYAPKHADGQLVMERHDTPNGSSGRLPPQYHVAPALPYLRKSQSLQCSDDIAPGLDPVNTELLFVTLPGQIILSTAVLLNVTAYFWALKILNADI